MHKIIVFNSYIWGVIDLINWKNLRTHKNFNFVLTRFIINNDNNELAAVAFSSSKYLSLLEDFSKLSLKNSDSGLIVRFLSVKTDARDFDCSYFLSDRLICWVNFNAEIEARWKATICECCCRCKQSIRGDNPFLLESHEKEWLLLTYSSHIGRGARQRRWSDEELDLTPKALGQLSLRWWFELWEDGDGSGEKSFAIVKFAAPLCVSHSVYRCDPPYRSVSITSTPSDEFFTAGLCRRATDHHSPSIA